MKILYINNEHCTSVEQLKGYFRIKVTSESALYADLLDYGRYGDIAAWLSENNESELATKVKSIPNGLGNSAFFAQLKSVITGEVLDGTDDLKPSFGSCLHLEDIQCNFNNNEAKLSIFLKILMCVNEEYEIIISSNWGTRAVTIIPSDYLEGKIAKLEVTFHKRPGEDVGEIVVRTSNDNLATIKPSDAQTSTHVILKSSQLQGEGWKKYPEIPTLPIELVDEEVIKFWIHTFSEQKFWVPNSSCKCIDLVALEEYILSAYHIKCDLSGFNTTIQKLLRYLTNIMCKQNPIAIKRKMLKNNASGFVDGNRQEIVMEMLRLNPAWTGATIGKRHPLKYIKVDSFIHYLRSNYGVEISKDELEVHALNLDSLVSYLITKCWE